MTARQATGAIRVLFSRLGDWWRRRRERAATLTGLHDCGRDELSRIAEDIGIGVGELQVLAGKWPAAADLVARRAAALSVHIAEIERTEPQVARDLKRVCSLCDDKRACEHDLSQNPDKSDWKDYCPNVETLEAIREIRKRKVD